MTDVEGQSRPSSSATRTSGKSTTAAATKETEDAKPKPLPRPPTAEMVHSAIYSLKGRRGSSLQAIKKFIGATYELDADKRGTYIRKYLRKAVASGTLVRIRGKGAAGSFKLPTEKDKKPTVLGIKKSRVSSPRKKNAGHNAVPNL